MANYSFYKQIMGYGLLAIFIFGLFYLEYFYSASTQEVYVGADAQVPTTSPPSTSTTIKSVEGINPSTTLLAESPQPTSSSSTVAQATTSTTFKYETQPYRPARVRVGNFDYMFNPMEVKTMRPDIFNENYFSAFDILAHIAGLGDIDLDYHFDESMNTFVVDSINGEPNWWYTLVYSGGWRENNVYRMDHYPWKDDSYLQFEKEKEKTITRIYETFQQEVERKTKNNGNIIIPQVIIRGPSTKKNFKEVKVTSHNKRNDIFKTDTITAMDAILSLGDLELLTYKLQWYETIGRADIVKNYWVEGINRDNAHGRCGFVYEEGAKTFQGGRGNHIHLPSDTRIINSPEYIEYFWICL